MLTAAAYGRLGTEPRQIETKTGKRMAVATLAVDVTAGEGPPLWLGIAAFGDSADALLQLGKGEPLSAIGRVQRKTWTDRQSGQVREQLQITADTIVSARTTRPGSRKRRSDNGQPAHAAKTPADSHPGFDDEIPF